MKASLRTLAASLLASTLVACGATESGDQAAEPGSAREADAPAPAAGVDESAAAPAPAQPAAPASPTEVSFATEDGGVVYGALSGVGERAVVLVHGARFTKESWAPQAERLASAGLRVLAIDLRGRGHSRGGPGANSEKEVQLDVLAAVRYLHTEGVRSVSVVGGSFGGWAAARAAVLASAGEIERLVLLAASPIENPEVLPGRKLFVVARDDALGAGQLRLPGIREQFERAPEPKQLVVLEGSAHAQHLFATEQGERLIQLIEDFLSAP